MTHLKASSATVRFRRAWVLQGLPAAAGLLVSLGVVAIAVWPTWQRLQIDQQELEQLAEQRQRLPLLRSQLLKLQDSVQQAEQRNAAIVGLIAGSGEITTFLAQLSAEAQRTGVVLDGYEPIVTQAPSADSQTTKGKAAKNKAPAPPAPPADPLLAPGLPKTSLLLAARGTGPQLLAFLRSLEHLSLLVVQSDLSLKQETKEPAKPGEAVATSTQLRLSLSLYSPADPPAEWMPKRSRS